MDKTANNIKVINCKSIEQLTLETVKYMKGPNIAVSGGQTYKTLFAQWSKLGPFEGVSFFPVDERMVPIDHPDSNWGQARQLFLSPLKKNTDIGHFAASASAYQQLLAKKVGDPPLFNTIFLGLGGDGHTASLFPQGIELAERNRSVIETKSPLAPVNRVTLTLPTLWAAKNLVTIVIGNQKRVIVDRLLAGDRSLPITLAVQGHSAPVLLLCD